MRLSRSLLSAGCTALFLLPLSVFAQAGGTQSGTTAAVPSSTTNFGTVDSKLAQEEAAILSVLKKKNEENGSLQPVAYQGQQAAPQMIRSTPSIVSAAQVTTPPSSNLLESKVRKQNKAISSLKTAKQSLEARVLKAEALMKEMMTELDETREELMLAETEVERLSHIIEQRNIKNIHRKSGARTTTAAKYQKHVSPRKSSIMNNPGSDQAQDQLTIATVMVDNANLRTGPGKGNSVLLQVSKNNRLVVEKRQGSWYRVIAPTGERAWIAGELIQFGPKKNARPTSTVRVKGMTDGLEKGNYAFREIKK